jgi:hypothetical protein
LPVSYERWEFYRRLSDARQAGNLRVRILGLGVDPLSLVADILTVAAFEAEFFELLFGRLAEVNAGGEIVSNGDTAGFAFTSAIVDRFSSGEPMQAAGAAVLKLARQHRRLLIR